MAGVDILMNEVCEILEELGYSVQKDDEGKYIVIEGEKIYFAVRYYRRGYAVDFERYDDYMLNANKKVYITNDVKKKIKRALKEISKTIRKEKEIKRKAEEEKKKKIEEIKKKLKDNIEIVDIYGKTIVLRVNGVKVVVSNYIGSYNAYTDREDLMKNPLDKQKTIENIKDDSFSGNVIFEKDKITDITLTDEKSLDDILEKLSQILS